MTTVELLLAFIGALLAAVNGLLLWQLKTASKLLQETIQLVNELRVGQSKVLARLEHMNKDLDRHEEDIREMNKFHRQVPDMGE